MRKIYLIAFVFMILPMISAGITLNSPTYSTYNIGENLELLINDGKTAIHKNYSDEYVKIKRGNKFGPLLIVHTDCLLKKQKVNKNE